MQRTPSFDVLPIDSKSLFCKDLKGNDYNPTKVSCVFSSCPSTTTKNIIIIIIIIFINCNCVVTRWQWLFYMYTYILKKVTRKLYHPYISFPLHPAFTLSLRCTSLHCTSLHFTSLHFTTLLYTFR